MGSGEAVLQLARKHIGETYVLGTRVPLGNSKWRGPWDCAEFASWCVYQSSGVLYGTSSQSNPIIADAYTGYWFEQGERDRALVEPDLAARIEGALLLRVPKYGTLGHIVISDGKGGTVEAHSSKDGVIAGKANNRVWDYGVLVPGIEYFQADSGIQLTMPTDVMRVTNPLTKSKAVVKVQRELLARGFHPGKADGVYGPQTAHAVSEFQTSVGLVADGEVGSKTRKALSV